MFPQVRCFIGKRRKKTKGSEYRRAFEDGPFHHMNPSYSL